MAENWLRWHVGTGNDPKWRVIARRSGQPIHACLAVWSMMLECAADAAERGTLDGWDDEDAGAALDLEEADVAAIRTAMQGKVLDGDRIAAWSKRQPKREREDDSSERVRAHRTRQKEAGNAAPNDVTPCNATSRQETPRGEEIREEQLSPLRSESDARDRRAEFDHWWSTYPNKVGKAAAEKAFLKARKIVEQQTLIDGVERYIATKPTDREWCNPATWLNQARWLDEPGPPAAARASPSRVPYSNASLARSLLQDTQHEHNSADPGRDGAALHRAKGHRERSSGQVVPQGHLRLAGPDEPD